jgi:hypothetical protein
MSTLQYRRSDGKLLYIESGADVGKLARECCCVVGGPPCDCDPPLDAVYTVTLSGFSSASDKRYSCADGAWDIEWTEDCTWYGRHTAYCSETQRYWDLTLDIATLAAPSYWRVRLRFCNSLWVPTVCSITWKLDLTGAPAGDPCAEPPPGAYTWLNSDGNCAGDADQSGVVSASVA